MITLLDLSLSNSLVVNGDCCLTVLFTENTGESCGGLLAGGGGISRLGGGGSGIAGGGGMLRVCGRLIICTRAFGTGGRCLGAGTGARGGGLLGAGLPSTSSFDKESLV